MEKLKAFGKINLALDVLGKRPDGYHEVRMIMQTIGIYDRLFMEESEGEEVLIESNLSLLPCDENNLVYKAAKLLMNEFGIRRGLKVKLEKQIPVAAGLAGGSSDAAATLVGVNRIFDLGLSKEELMERGVKIGADVPYCVMRGTALSEGIGEKLTPLDPVPGDVHVVLAKIPVSVSTARVYGGLKPEDIKERPDIDGMIKAIGDGDIRGIASAMGNVLETVTIPMYPRLAEIKKAFMDEGALGSLMSGSGPTVFGLFDDIKKARKAYRNIKVMEPSAQVFLTRMLNSYG